MPRFIATHPVAFSDEQLRPLAKEPLPEGVTWHSTFCAYAEHRAYCHWEAPTKEALAEIFKKHDIPFDSIWEVRLFDPATGQLEAEPAKATS